LSRNAEAQRTLDSGSALDLFRAKIEQKLQSGGANSLLRIFKQFRQMASSANNLISHSEFRRALRQANVELTE
jgi:hypothetical protein